LRDQSGTTILMDDGGFGTESPPMGSMFLGHQFCLPLGPGLRNGECGVFTNEILSKVFADRVPGVSSYQFEFQDPDGDGHSAGNVIRRISSLGQIWTRFDLLSFSFPLEYGVRYMCRVRADVGGDGFSNDHFGEACELGLTADGPPCTQLMDRPTSITHSCGVTRTLDGRSKLWALPLAAATDFEFRFEEAGGGNVFLRNPPGPYVLVLHANTLPAGTYDVTVQAFLNGVWTGFCGPTCSVTILPPPPSAGSKDLIASNTSEVKLWPNPVHNETLTLRASNLVEDAQNVTIDIYDMFGKVVYQEQLNNEGEELNTIINFQDMSTGIYIVNITINDVSYMERLVVE